VTKIDVSIFPTLPVHAGMSMSHYTDELVQGLHGISDVLVRVEWPPFGAEPSAGWLRSRWVRYVEYVRWCGRLPGDLFHIADHSNAQLLLTLPGSQTVVTCHDLYPVAVALGRVRFTGSQGRVAMAASALRVSLLRKAAAIVAISEHTLAECRDYLGIKRDRLFVGYHGVAARFLSNNGAGAVESFKARHRIQPGWLHILHVGSNDPRKNLGTVFRVVAALKQRHKKDVCLVKVGSAFGPRETQAIQTMGLQEAVRHLGELSDEEIAHVYRACDVLLYPSFHEGMGRPVAEAMASGTPVVASNRGAIPEVVQHPNSLFDPEDVDGMTNQILQITASKDLREELVQHGKLAAQKFTWEAHAQAVAEAYRSVVQRWV